MTRLQLTPYKTDSSRACGTALEEMSSAGFSIGLIDILPPPMILSGCL